MKTRLRFLGCVLTLALPLIGRTSSLAATGAVVPSRPEVYRWLRLRNYDRLEEIASELRQEKLNFYSGHVKLSEFYSLFEINPNFDDNTWADQIYWLKKWADARTNSPTPLVALGRVYKEYAWKARGGGYANTVSQEGWRLFDERLNRARDYLDNARGMIVQDPEAYRARIVVAMGLSESKEEVDRIFKKGVTVEPNYLPLYEAKAYYLLPRWLGEPGDWERFATEAANARGGEEGDMLYMIIARSQAWSEGDALFENTQISYPRMKRGFEASFKRTPGSLYEMNSFCYFACIANDKAAAKSLFQEIGGRWEKGVWKDETQFQVWQNWALSGARAPRIAGENGSAVAGDSQQKVKKFLVIGGAVWLVLITAVGIGCWLLIRSGQKRS